MPTESITELSALPDAALDERLAGLLEPKPEDAPIPPWREFSEGECWRPGRDGGWVPLKYSSEDSPRSLLKAVEAEIARRGLESEYAAALLELRRDMAAQSPFFVMATAPARARVVAAIACLQGGQ